MPAERLPSFTHFIAAGDEVISWHDAIAHAQRNGETTVLGVTWDASQRLNLDGTVTTTTQEDN